MDITRTKTNRTISEDEMLRLIKLKPFEGFRQDAKAINFGFIFGMTSNKFAKITLETSWTPEKLDNFLNSMRLSPKEDEVLLKDKYILAADYIRSQFFKSYPGLKQRIVRNSDLLKTQGYLRSIFGVIRRLPLLFFAYNNKGFLRKNNDMKLFSSMINIGANSTIQSAESIIMMKSIDQWMKGKWGKITPIIGMVHDSCDFYVPKENAYEILQDMKNTFEKNESWQRGVKFPIDIVICDLQKGDYYKKGTKLEKYNFNFSE